MSGTARENRLSWSDRLHSPMVTGVILAVAAVSAVTAWYASRQAVEERSELHFEFQSEQLATAIQDRMIVYEQVLWGGAGLFNASNEVSREEWYHYVSSLDLAKHWPGIQGMGFSLPLEPNEVEAHVAQIRAEGFPDYEVRPTEARDEYTAIVYLEPFDERNQRAFGYDMWSNDQRRAAMRAARDSGLAVTSGAITLVQETDVDVQRGFLTYVPVYDMTIEPRTSLERREHLRGWVYAAFRMGDLMEGILDNEEDGFSYEIFDGRQMGAEMLLFDSDDEFAGGSAVEDSEFRKITIVTLQGRTWLVSIQANSSFVGANEARQPIYVAVTGLIVNVLLLILFISQRRAQSMAEITTELRTTKRELESQATEMQIHTEQLVRSNGELTQFAYAASHDLQEPLRNLGSYANLLSTEYENELGDEGRRWLGYISGSAERMSDLLRELLEYASLDGDMDDYQSIDLDTVLTAALADLDKAITEADAVIIRDPLPAVTGNGFQLERLLLNLVGNAIKYRAEDRQPTVWVSLTDSGAEWRVAIRDNGIGIKPEYHQRVFELFRRVGPRSKYQGTGIGLAVCQKIVTSHGGLVGVNSTPNEGSEFWFTLPKMQSDQSIDLGQQHFARH